MGNRVEKLLNTWQDAGLLDDATAERIREFELSGATGLGWPVKVLIAFGGVTIGAGILLFVAAHWDTIAPFSRFVLVLALVAVFHVAGALLHGRFKAMSVTAHAVGTAALGAGIFLAGQVFNLAEHWPGGVMLWAAGAWAGWYLLRDWPHAIWIAVLTPAWLVGEWTEAAGYDGYAGVIAAGGLALLCLAYLTARSVSPARTWHTALGLLGTVAMLPFAVYAVVVTVYLDPGALSKAPEPGFFAALLPAIGWITMIVAPVIVAYIIDPRALRAILAGALWLVAMIRLADQGVWLYLWCTVGSLAMIGWGLVEARRERINLGVAAFAVTVMFFYFSSVADKLDRAMSLIVLGALLLGGGWALERARRRLLSRIRSFSI